MTSEASGGFAVTNTDDFTSGVKRIVDDLDHYYLLGFYPIDTKGKGYRSLDVTVAGHPDWKLRFRRGYMPGGPPAAPKSADPLVALSAGILPKTDLPLRLSAIAIPGTGVTTKVVLALEVTAPRRALQEADGKVRDTLKYEVLIVDEKKAKVRTVTGLEGRLTLSPLGPSEAAPESVSYQMEDAIDVPPGHYEIRVSALSAKLAKGGSVYLDMEVPDFHAAAAVIARLGDRLRRRRARAGGAEDRSGRPAVRAVPRSRLRVDRHAARLLRGLHARAGRALDAVGRGRGRRRPRRPLALAVLRQRRSDPRAGVDSPGRAPAGRLSPARHARQRRVESDPRSRFRDSIVQFSTRGSA